MAENTDHSFTKSQSFSGYLKHPEEIDFSDEKMIGSLIERFPYAQTLHAFQAKCHNDTDGFDNYLSKAALYAPDRNILYHIIHKPAALTLKPAAIADPVIEEQPIRDTGNTQENSISVQETSEEHTVKSAAIADPVIEEQLIEDTHNTQENSISLQETPEMSDPAESETATYRAIEDTEFEMAGEIDQVTEDAEPETINSAEEDISFISGNAKNHESTLNSEAETLADESEAEYYPDNEADAPEATEGPEKGTGRAPDDTEKQIISNIASSDFFRFEEKIDDRFTSHIHNERPGEPFEQKKGDAQSVSKYDDDTMPYTFLWWLNKTRKEHSDTYQPYVNFKLDTTEDIKKEAAAPDLNQQIIENIFHLQSPLEGMPEKEQPQTVEFTLKRKDDQIIERFIREEPQIRPPRPENLDTENKARKSSEDSYDMVSETLAQVYIEQMLFNKAIDTYKKLSLKFPEKSAYFADQIRKLETTNKE